MNLDSNTSSQKINKCSEKTNHKQLPTPKLNKQTKNQNQIKTKQTTLEGAVVLWKKFWFESQLCHLTAGNPGQILQISFSFLIYDIGYYSYLTAEYGNHFILCKAPLWLAASKIMDNGL